MKYYFAARYSRHPEMRVYRDELLAAIPGATVTSRWIDQHGGELASSYTPRELNEHPNRCWGYGQDDLEDLAASDAIVSFTGTGGVGKGGRHVEHGIAIAWADILVMKSTSPYRLIVIGPRENIFHCHPATEVYPDWVSFLVDERDRAIRPSPGP